MSDFASVHWSSASFNSFDQPSQDTCLNAACYLLDTGIAETHTYRGALVAWLAGVQSISLVEGDVLPVQLLHQTGFEVDQLIHFLCNKKTTPFHFFKTSYI